MILISQASGPPMFSTGHDVCRLFVLNARAIVVVPRYRTGGVGYAAAASMVLLVILMVIAIIQLRISKRNNAW